MRSTVFAYVFLFLAVSLHSFSQKVGIGTTSPNSSLDVRGSMSYKITKLTTSATLSETDAVVLCNSATPLTVTLPSAAGIAGRAYTLKNVGDGPVTLTTTGGETLEGSILNIGTTLGPTVSMALSVKNNALKVISDGANWLILEEKINGFYIGQDYGGGKIAYLDASGQHGLIAAPALNVLLHWSTVIQATGATGTAIGTGQANTTTIVTALGDAAEAAKYCDTMALNGYSDWYLPSKDELNAIYTNRNALQFLSSGYWSSSETSADAAWLQTFENGNQLDIPKAGITRFIPVRSF